MKLPLMSNSLHKLELETSIIDYENIKASSDVLVLYVGGFCGNAEYLSNLNEQDQQTFHRLINEIEAQRDYACLKMFAPTTENYFKNIIVHNSSNSKFHDTNTSLEPYSYWVEFFYALTRGALELAASTNAETITFTHLTSPPESQTLIAHALAIGNWWDEYAGKTTINKIIFEGCGVTDDYLKTFLEVDPKVKMNKIYDSVSYQSKTWMSSIGRYN